MIDLPAHLQPLYAPNKNLTNSVLFSNSPSNNRNRIGT